MKRPIPLLPIVLAVLAGCATDSSGTPDSLLNQDLATVAGDAAAQDVELMRGPGGPLGMRLPADPSKFECTSTTRDGLTVERSCVFKDANGNTQAAYDPSTTATATVHSKVDGTVDRGHWGGEIHRLRDFTVSGLAGAETTITWNGTGSGSAKGVRPTRDGGSVDYEMTESSVVANVVIPVPRTDTGWPLSGTITSTMTGKRGDSTITRNAVITFNGTQMATVVVNGETFQFDLAGRGRCKKGGGRP
jgi:hypothetical protein